MGGFVVRIDDPEAADVQALLHEHLDFARRHSPPEDVHALDLAGLLAVDMSFFSSYSVYLTLRLDQDAG